MRVMRTFGLPPWDFQGRQTLFDILQNCLIVNYRSLKSIQLNIFFFICAAIMTTNTPMHFSVVMNLTYVLSAVFPVFKLHLRDTVSLSFLSKSWGSKDGPIVSRAAFYNHT